MKGCPSSDAIDILELSAVSSENKENSKREFYIFPRNKIGPAERCICSKKKKKRCAAGRRIGSNRGVTEYVKTMYYRIRKEA